MKALYKFIALSSLLSFSLFGQQKYEVYTVAFYNLENLFDTIDDPHTLDEISPMMDIKGARSKTYRQKIENMARVLAAISATETGAPPVLIGLAEIENHRVLEDLIASPPLQAAGYEFIHYDAPDARGIDVALLYQRAAFIPSYHRPYELRLWDDKGQRIFTRDQLLVSGYLGEEVLHLIVNHWPSRRGGEARSSPKREQAAWLCKQVVAGLYKTDPEAKIIVMGDFNDNPPNKSIRNVLQATGKPGKITAGGLYNPMESLFKKGHHSLVYRDRLYLFDQLMVSKALVAVEKEYNALKIYKTGIFNPVYLTQQTGRYRGYPFRSFSHNGFTGGYSDHYPVYLYLIKAL